MYNYKFGVQGVQRMDENTSGGDGGGAIGASASGDEEDEDDGEENSMPNDYTFALMMKIWRENAANDVPVRAQHLFESLLSRSPMSIQNRFSGSSSGGSGGSSSSGVSSSSDRQHSLHAYFEGVPRVDVRPSEHTYDALVQVWYASDPEKASRIVDRMVALGLSPAPEMYSKLMIAWADRERGDQCDDVLARLLAAGLRPDAPTCHALLRAHATGNSEALSDSDAAERTERALERLLQVRISPVVSLLKTPSCL